MDRTKAAYHEPASTQAHLPAQLTATIGRADEISALVSLLKQEEARLITLTGPGGVGKTRLGLEVARAVQNIFTDGVFFVSLAPLREQGQALLAIAQAIGIDEAGGQALERRLREYLQEKHCLILLDNCEQVLSAMPLVSDLLQHAPRLTVLATSREMLHLYGEREIVVPPLALPSYSGQKITIPGAAMTLFVERARAVKPAFALNDENRRAVAEICVQLDGLPLAIELAAARIKLLSPQAIVERLSRRFNLLTGGARDLPRRQQTLRNTLDWSYELLTKQEQCLFRSLGVFVGTWSLEAVEAIASEEAPDSLSLLTSLVDKSLLLLVENGATETRFLLLETIREYALERLQCQGEDEEARRRHALYYLKLAEDIEEQLQGAGQQEGLQCLDREAANLRAALRWTIERNEAALALRLASALRDYLPLRGSASEDRQWFEEVLALPGAREASVQRARVLYGAGVLARMRSDLQRAKQRLAESREMARQVEDRHTLALTLGMLAQLELYPGHYDEARSLVEEGLQVVGGEHDRWCRGILHRISGTIASKQGDFATAQTRYSLSLMSLSEVGDRRNGAETLIHLGSMMRLRGKLRTSHYLYERALRLLRALGDRWGQLACLNCMGEALWVQGDYTQARACFAESMELATLLGDRAEQIATLTGLGRLALSLGDENQASRSLKEALRLAREMNYMQGLAMALCGLGDLARLRNEWSSATAYYTQGLELVKTTNDRLMMISLLHGLGDAAREQHKNALACAQLKQSLHLAWEIGNHVALTAGIEALAWLCIQAGQPEHGAFLLGAAHELRETLQTPLAPIYRETYARNLGALKGEIGLAAFNECWAEGRSLLLKQVMALGVARVYIAETPERVSTKASSLPYNLTARELDVLRLLAQGYPDARIAKLLVVSPRTVNTHLRSIYAKLGVSSRSAATRIALEQKLV